jgi:peptidyl-prolyl cis-trans isomerase B (cyclophilin B)
MVKKIFFLFIFTLFINQLNAGENIMILKLKDGDVIIEMFEEIAPNAVKRIKQHHHIFFLLQVV